MDEILHHFETMGSHCSLVFTGESLFQGFLDGAKWISSVQSMSSGAPGVGPSQSKPASQVQLCEAAAQGDTAQLELLVDVIGASWAEVLGCTKIHPFERFWCSCPRGFHRFFFFFGGCHPSRSLVDLSRWVSVFLRFFLVGVSVLV